MSNVEKLEDILNQTSDRIENFQQAIKGKSTKKSDLDNLQQVLQSSKVQITEITKSLKGTKQKPNLSDKTMNRIFNAINSLSKDPSSQVKAGAIETSLFYETVKEFQNLLENLKIKRGEKAEKVDLGGL